MKEFFEAFDIPKKTDKLYGMNLCYPIEEYPPITAEIREKLEEMILTEYSHISHVQKYGYPIMDKQNKKRVGTDWNYIYIVEVYAGCDELDCQNYDRYEGKGKTRQEALLNLCIDLKNEIYTEVKALFV